MSVDEATPFYAYFEVKSGDGFVVLTGTLAEASKTAREFAAASGKSAKVSRLPERVLVVSGWSPAEPVHQDEVIKPTGCEVPGCTSHKAPAVPHDNCMYGGRRMGHSPAHCTADACY